MHRSRDVVGPHRWRLSSGNYRPIFLFLVCCVTAIVFLRPSAEPSVTSFVFQPTSNEDFQLPLVTVTVDGSDFRVDEVQDQTQPSGKPHDTEVRKPEVLEPSEPHDVYKPNQTSKKILAKMKFVYNKHRTIVHWTRKKSIEIVNDIYPGPSLPAPNITLSKSGSCFRQVHLWKSVGLSASGRVGDFFCPGLPCGLRLVVDMNLETLNTSDAVILYHGSPWDWAEMYRYRPPDQRWIFYSIESPVNAWDHVIPPNAVYDSAYDYVMSYRSSESHLYASYGYYKPFTDTRERQFTKIQNWAANKTRIVAWLASNCQLVSWDRKEFVEALSTYIPVSMYGKCGTKSCPKDERCQRKLRKHKFYLALENTACREYITEKVWKNAFHNNLVPVVYGAPRCDYERLLPPNSFIHVEDFPSIKALARYLRKLHKNETLYNAYFEWRKFGSVTVTTEKWLMEPEQICSNIVRKLLEDDKALYEGTFKPPKFPDWEDWWTRSCLPVDISSWPIKLK